MSKTLVTLTFTTDQDVDDPQQIIEQVVDSTQEFGLTLKAGGVMRQDGEYQAINADQFAHATRKDAPER